jgi:hypothetical protein
MPQVRRRIGCGLAALTVVVAVVVANAPDAFAQTPRTHHGLYVRLAGGASYFSDAVTSDPLPFIGTVEGTLKGGAISTQFAVGASISPGFVVGGALFVNHMPAPSATNAASHDGVLSGPIADVDFDPSTLTIIGPFADWYVDPSGGWHVQAGAGYGLMSLGQGNERGSGVLRVHDQKGSGFAAVLGGGYEWWVSSSWGIGVLGQLTVGWGSGEDTTNHTWRHRILVPGLLFSATMN